MKDAPSLWQTLAPPAPSMPPLRGERRCDVAVVGGGFLGLSTALHLAEAGASVVVVEAETAGFGASGRNTGFVVPALKSTLGPADVEAAIGPAHAERLVDLVGGSGRLARSRFPGMRRAVATIGRGAETRRIGGTGRADGGALTIGR